MEKSSLKTSFQPGRSVRPPGTVGVGVTVVAVVEPAVVVGGAIVGEVVVVVVGAAVVVVAVGVTDLVGDANGLGVPVVVGRQRELWPFGRLHGSAPTGD